MGGGVKKIKTIKYPSSENEKKLKFDGEIECSRRVALI